MRRHFLLINFILLVNSGFTQPIARNSKIDSAQSYFAKYVLTDSINLKFRYLEKAIKFEPVDSMYYFLANCYTQLTDYAEVRKCDYKALRAKIQTQNYAFYELDGLISGLEATGYYHKAIHILKRAKGDSIIFNGYHIAFSRKNQAHYINSINENASISREEINSFRNNTSDTGFYARGTEISYALMAYYSYSLGRRVKANHYFSMGFRKYPNGKFLYFEKGRMDLFKGCYEMAASDFYKAKGGEPWAEIFLYRALKLLEIPSSK